MTQELHVPMDMGILSFQVFGSYVRTYQHARANLWRTQLNTDFEVNFTAYAASAWYQG
jgi:hypothetical protein